MDPTDIFPGLRCLDHGTGPVPPCPPHEAMGVPHLLVRSRLGLQSFEATGGGWMSSAKCEAQEDPYPEDALEWWVVQAVEGK